MKTPLKAPLVLFTHSLRRVRVLILAMGLLLAVFQVLLILVARSIQRSDAFEQMNALIPPFVRALIGPSITSLMSFGGIVCVGYFHVAVMGSLITLVIALATTTTSEIETGFMDLILARPLPRHWMVTRSILVILVATASLLVMMMAGTWAGLEAFAPRDAAWPTPELIRSLALNLGLLMLCWSGVACAIGTASRRRSVAGALAGLLALSTFLLDYLARAWKPAESIAWLSPFRYYSPFDLLLGKPLPESNLLVLSGIALAGFVAAYFIFSRRDISH